MKYKIDKIATNYEILERNFPRNDPKMRFFHYTSQASFFAMFKDYIDDISLEGLNEENIKYINIFASQMQYLNDKQEFIEGVKIIQNANIDTNELFESIFISCFCGTEDLLSQWKYYGKQCGISIEFDFSESTKLCWFESIAKNSKQTPSFIYWPVISPHRVIYDNHQNIFDDIKQEVTNGNIFKDVADKEAANLFVPHCKNKYFSEEDESRLILYPIKSELANGETLFTTIDYRVSNGKIIPQFKCKVAYADENKAQKKAPIKSIMVGPGDNQRLVFNSIINMLETNKSIVKFYTDEELDLIIKSNIQLKSNKIGICNDRITYNTDNNILISMSAAPFRD